MQTLLKWVAGYKLFCLCTLIGPCREKTCLQGFWQSEIQTSLLSYRDKLENWHFACSKFRYDILSKKQITKVLIRLHACAGWSVPELLANPRRQVFWRRGPIIGVCNITQLKMAAFLFFTNICNFLIFHLISIRFVADCIELKVLAFQIICFQSQV